MNVKTVYWFFEKFSKDNLSLFYNGNFSDDITDRFVNISEFSIGNYEEFKKQKKRISFLLIECFQNVIRHGEKTEHVNNGFDRGFFSARNRQGYYRITSGNLIENENIDSLKNQLQKINSMSPDELKSLYRDVMQHSSLSEKGGAGLGLIDIARKSGQKLGFIFEKFNDKLSFYYNQVTLKSELLDNDTKPFEELPLSAAIENHKKMLQENIMVIQKGDYSHKSILPILNIIETNLKKEFKESYQKKHIYHVLVELLQNINKHCIEKNSVKEGILIIAKSESNFIINTGNYIEENKIDELKAHLEMLNSTDKNELSNLYMKILMDVTGYGESAGIGLIDIARSTPEPIQYDFVKTLDDKYFFSISVTI